MAARGRTHETDDLIVDGLAAGMTYGEAGAAAGVSGRTVRRRMDDRGFRNAVFAARDARLEQLRRKVVEAVPAALRVLEQISEHGASESTRVASARAIVSFGLDQRPSKLGTVGFDEFVRIVNVMHEEALRVIPPEEQQIYLHSVIAALGPNI